MGKAIHKEAEQDGLVEAGNIDLKNRPVVNLDDGKIATVRSTSFNFGDGVEVLVPTVSDDGKLLSPDEAAELYLKTGKHLGKFKTPEQASAYGKRLSADQDKMYNQTPLADRLWPGMGGKITQGE